MKKLFILLLVLTTFVFAQVEVSTRLTRALQNSKSTDYVKGLILLKDQVDIETLDARLYKEHATLQQRAYTVITALQEVATRTQGNLTAYLEQKKGERKVFSYQKFWIANMIQIEAQREVFQELMSSMELSQMDLDAELQIDRPVITQLNAEQTETVENGLKIINADKLWRMGITGQGRIVMGIDTGVEKNHPALNYKWRGTHVPANQAWFDPAGTTSPTDCDGHGTHTIGTMCGLSPTTGDTVGVAIGAEWIAAKTICSSPHTSNSVAAFQWALNPDGNPNTINDMPDAISSSWYDPDVSDECNGIYKTTLNAVEAAGIAAVFSAGNSGPSASTITKPKNINTDETNVFAVAAISGASYLGGSNDPIASFSSRGPSVCGGTGALLIKPEVSAPGVAVRSAYPPTGYTSMDGTSMASPHVAGAIALLKSFAPTLTGKQIKLALYNTAKDLGAVGEDNNYGRGLIDVYAAYLTLGTPDTTPPAKTTDLAVIEPTSNALKITWTAPADTSPNGVVGYNIRYAATPITDTTSFNNAMAVPFNTAPKPAGQTETVRVDSLVPASTYYFALRSRDVWGNWSLLSNVASGATLAAPVAATTPDSLKKLLIPNQIVVDSVMISNTSTSPSTLGYLVSMANNTFPQGLVEVALVPVTRAGDESLNIKTTGDETHFGQMIEGQGGPDSAGYKWIDSDEPNGPQYVWNDISTTGTAVTAWTATGTFDPKDEGYAGPFQFGFPFKFYRQAKTQVYISSNGALLFNVPTANIFTNAAIPTVAAPNEYIAAFWDDLDGRTQGTVHYKADGDKFIVQFTNWQKYSATGSLTFQYVLYPSGKIMLYYNNMNATLNSATVGIENATGTNGLQIAYNATYVKNNLAVKISAEPDWVNAQNLSGMLYQGNSAAIRLIFRSEDYPAGNYGMDLKIRTNDPAHQMITIPVKMTLNHPAIPVTVTAPNGGENWQAGTVKNITWNANDIANVNIKYSTDNGVTWIGVAQSVAAASGSYAWTVPATPSTQCKVRISAAAADSLFDVSNANFTISAGAITWSSVVNVKDNSNLLNQDLTFGLAPSATNGIDVALGEVSLPPAPPAGTFDARFELPVTPADYSWKDYRADTAMSVVWMMKFQPGAAGYPFTITWNAATLPAGSFALKDAVTGTIVNVDMKAQSSYTLSNTGVTGLKIEYTKLSAVPMSFAAGWNMFSVPLVGTDMSAATICSGANSNVFGYGATGYTSATTLGNGKGYWVRYAASSNYNMNGAPVTGNTMALTAGWNMIGPYHWNVAVSGITTTPAGIINSSFFEYNNGYTQATTLQKTKGYWVRTSAAGTMTMPATVEKAGDVVLQTPSKDWARIIITDATGAAQTLFAATAGNEAAASAFELPPVPPAGIFDVRYTTDRNVAVLSAQPAAVQISGAQYPVKVQVVGTELTLTDNATGGKMINTTLRSGDAYTITNSGIAAVAFSNSLKPAAYELLQNYPNPFNPSTTIKFGLPEKSNVTLTIYNQLGEKIAVLLSGDKDAGYHTVEWNAANQVSGVYFYEIKTDKFTSIKKLILMK